MKLKPGSGRLLQHPVRKRIGPTIQLPGPHGPNQYNLNKIITTNTTVNTLNAG